MKNDLNYKADIEAIMDHIEDDWIASNQEKKSGIEQLRLINYVKSLSKFMLKQNPNKVTYH